MKKTASFIFVVLLFLLTTSCLSAPNWSGAETNAGEFVWSYSPGIRFYINVILLGTVFGALIVSLIRLVIEQIRKKEKLEWSGLGCGTIILLFLALALWGNIRDYIWYESFSINQDRIERISYPTAWKTEKKTETLEWKNVNYFSYIPEKYLESTTWVKVSPITRERVGKGKTEEGVKGRVIILSEKGDKSIEFVLEKKSYDTAVGDFLSNIGKWIFGSEDYAVSPEEERRLKTALNKYLPEKVKAAATNETKEYMNKQE